MSDHDGVDLPGGANLEACARYLAKSLRDDGALADVSLDGCAIEVTDSRGALVTTVFVPAPGA